MTGERSVSGVFCVTNSRSVRQEDVIFPEKTNSEVRKCQPAASSGEEFVFKWEGAVLLSSQQEDGLEGCGVVGGDLLLSGDGPA